MKHLILLFLLITGSSCSTVPTSTDDIPLLPEIIDSLDQIGGARGFNIFCFNNSSTMSHFYFKNGSVDAKQIILTKSDDETVTSFIASSGKVLISLSEFTIFMNDGSTEIDNLFGFGLYHFEFTNSYKKELPSIGGSGEWEDDTSRNFYLLGKQENTQFTTINIIPKEDGIPNAYQVIDDNPFDDSSRTVYKKLR